MEGVLDGVRVLDVSESASGAYCGRLLACYGAEVIKVEPPGTGDPARRAGPFPEDRPDPEASAAFLYLNAGKKGITLNLEAAGGQAVLRELAAAADVLLEDAGPGVMDGRGLGWEDLARVNPALIYVSLSPFGATGPYATYRATQLTLYALGGYMYLTGDPDREPLQGPGSQPAYLAGAHALTGVMLALLAREAGAGGQRVEVSELESVAAAHQWTITRYNYSGTVQRRIGNRYDFGHPITIYPCADGYVGIGISTDEQAERFFVLIGRPELLADPRFGTNLARLLHADEFDEIVLPWFRARGKEEITRLCQELRVPCSPVTEVDELLANEHLAARGFWQEVPHPAAGTLHYPGPPFRMSETPGRPGRAPLLGEHNEEVYGVWLGYDRQRLTLLRRAGVI